MNTLILTKNYKSENLNERDEKKFDPNQFEILRKKKQKSRSTEENIEREREREREREKAN